MWAAMYARFDTGCPHVQVAGGPGISVMEPRWATDGQLLFISDEGSGWWNLHRRASTGAIENIMPMQAELGGPAWQLGAASYQPLADGRY